jgi:hypothetical protein
MKKLALLAFAVMLVPAMAGAQCVVDAQIEHYGGGLSFPGDTLDVFPGEVTTWNLASCSDGPDTFCYWLEGSPGWTIDDSEECAHLPSSGCWWFPGQGIDLQAPCSGVVGEYDTIYLVLGVCCEDYPDPGDCTPYVGQDSSVQYFHYVPPPPALSIEQDTLGYVDAGLSIAYVPFALCCADFCQNPEYGYVITSLGHVGSAISQGDTVPVAGGGCTTVYAQMNASSAVQCDYDTLTIIAWETEAPYTYDTCVQIIHVINPEPVPLFTAPVVTILVLAMILAAAVIMRRRAVSRA